jgi:hypothetical protein
LFTALVFIPPGVYLLSISNDRIFRKILGIIIVVEFIAINKFHIGKILLNVLDKMPRHNVPPVNADTLHRGLHLQEFHNAARNMVNPYYLYIFTDKGAIIGYGICVRNCFLMRYRYWIIFIKATVFVGLERRNE